MKKKKGRIYKKTTRRTYTMAKRGGRIRRYARSQGGYKSLLAPIAGGAVDIIAQKYIPLFGVGSTVFGMVLKDSITMKMGLNKIGESLGAMFGGNGGNGGGL